MFQHLGKLHHSLPPEAYFDPLWHEREQAVIFRSAWNYFCRFEQIARHWDRFAASVCGTPVVVINHRGDFFALENVCAHRHSQIVADGSGHAEKLRCQIHGWEYAPSGVLSHLPDGRSFIGVKANEFCLRRYRVERCGPFIFVNLSLEGSSFEAHLGGFAAEFHSFYDEVRHVGTWVSEHTVNWKIPVENAVESYHVPMVHPSTYENYRAEELHDHRLEPTFTRYGDLLPYEAEKSLEALGFRVYTRFLIRGATFSRFSHVHLFPNCLLYFGDVFRNLTIVEPLGPEQCRFTTVGFVPRGIRGGWAGRVLQDLSMIVFLAMGRKIIREDMRLWPPVQQGLKRSRHQGVLGAREERVFAFQQFIAQRVVTAESSTDDAELTHKLVHGQEKAASCER